MPGIMAHKLYSLAFAAKQFCWFLADLVRTRLYSGPRSDPQSICDCQLAIGYWLSAIGFWRLNNPFRGAVAAHSVRHASLTDWASASAPLAAIPGSRDQISISIPIRSGEQSVVGTYVAVCLAY